MLANRMQYVIYFQGQQVIEKIKSLPVDIAYVSEKQNYMICYGDANIEKSLRKQLKDVKGFKHIALSQAFNESLNF